MNDFLRPFVPSKAADAVEGVTHSVSLEAQDVLNDIRDAAAQGLDRLAESLSRDPALQKLVPSPDVIRALRKPSIALSAFLIMVTRPNGSTLTARLHSVKAFLALAKSESGYDPSMRRTIPTVYNGRKVVSRVMGTLSFTRATYDASLKRGASIISNDRVLRPTFDAMLSLFKTAGWAWKYGSSDLALDPNQVIANVGQMAALNATADKEWDWNPDKGWTSKKPLAGGAAGAQFAILAKNILLKRDEGRMALLSFYHINGLYALNFPFLAEKGRYAQDVANFSSSGAPDLLRKAIAAIRPETDLFNELGVGDVAEPIIMASSDLGKRVIADAVRGMIKEGYQPPAVQAAIARSIDAELAADIDRSNLMNRISNEPWWYNKFIKGVYGFKFNHIPQGDATLSAGYDDPRSYGKHGAYDYTAVIGQPVFAMDTGRCFNHGKPGKYNEGFAAAGRWINQEGAALGMNIEYMHLSKSLVKDGEIAVKGTIIGFSGHSGHSSGPHLHIGLRDPKTNSRMRWPLKTSDPKDSINKRGT